MTLQMQHLKEEKKDRTVETVAKAADHKLSVTDFTMTSISAAFLAQHTCKRYYEYNKELLIGTRRQELLSELAHE